MKKKTSIGSRLAYQDPGFYKFKRLAGSLLYELMMCMTYQLYPKPGKSSQPDKMPYSFLDFSKQFISKEGIPTSGYHEKRISRTFKWQRSLGRNEALREWDLRTGQKVRAM